VGAYYLRVMMVTCDFVVIIVHWSWLVGWLENVDYLRSGVVMIVVARCQVAAMGTLQKMYYHKLTFAPSRSSVKIKTTEYNFIFQSCYCSVDF